MDTTLCIIKFFFFISLCGWSYGFAWANGDTLPGWMSIAFWTWLFFFAF